MVELAKNLFSMECLPWPPAPEASSTAFLRLAFMLLFCHIFRNGKSRLCPTGSLLSFLWTLGVLKEGSAWTSSSKIGLGSVLFLGDFNQSRACLAGLIKEARGFQGSLFLDLGGDGGNLVFSKSSSVTFDPSSSVRSSTLPLGSFSSSSWTTSGNAFFTFSFSWSGLPFLSSLGVPADLMKKANPLPELLLLWPPLRSKEVRTAAELDAPTSGLLRSSKDIELPSAGTKGLPGGPSRAAKPLSMTRHPGP